MAARGPTTVQRTYIQHPHNLQYTCTCSEQDSALPAVELQSFPEISWFAWVCFAKQLIYWILAFPFFSSWLIGKLTDWAISLTLMLSLMSCCGFSNQWNNLGEEFHWSNKHQPVYLGPALPRDFITNDALFFLSSYFLKMAVIICKELHDFALPTFKSFNIVMMI